MEKTRVKKGEKYWVVYLIGDKCAVTMMTAGLNSPATPTYDTDCFQFGNYFNTKEEAEAMARKLRAVLNGADVIEMPSDDEISKERPKNDGNRYFNEGKNLGWWSCVGFFKSKIVK